MLQDYQRNMYLYTMYMVYNYMYLYTCIFKLEIRGQLCIPLFTL